MQIPKQKNQLAQSQPIAQEVLAYGDINDPNYNLNH
jgi:hypothetical protein